MNYQEIRVKNKRIIAFDFDGTLSSAPIYTSDESEELIPKPEIIEYAQKMYKDGHCIIIWTCRAGEEEQRPMVKFLKKYDVRYHYINENVEGLPFKTSKKIFYDIIIDDRAVNVNELSQKLLQGDVTGFER